jgi:hypothetical protein
MYTFLILSSLGLVFYVALLIALYRDGRKQRVMSVPPVRKLLAGSMSEFATDPSEAASTLSARERNSSDGVLWIPVTKHHWKPVSRNAGSNREKLVHLAEPVSTKDDRPMRLKNR